MTGFWARGWFLVVLLSGVTLGVARADTASGLDDFRNGRFSEAVAAWRGAAEQGDAAASLYLGVLYDTGFAVAQDPAQALSWYRRGAAGGNQTAMLNAAIMVDAGRGTAADPAAAIPLYKQAAQAGSGRAAFNLGLLYDGGIGVTADRAQAMQYFREAAKDGVAAGRARLGSMGDRHAVLVGRPKVDLAMVDFQQAQHALLTRGPDADARAAALFRRAADAGNPLAAYNLGYCYEHGIGVAANASQAMEWYRRSAAGASDPALRDIASSGEKNLSAGNTAQR